MIYLYSCRSQATKCNYCPIGLVETNCGYWNLSPLYVAFRSVKLCSVGGLALAPPYYEGEIAN